MKKDLFLILLFLFGLAAFAQIPKEEIEVDIDVFPKEISQVLTNSDILLAGETLQYKIFILNDSGVRSSMSKIGYVSLRNENDSVIFNHKLKLENGVANSDFFLPSSLNTGIYRLIGYTNFSRNNTIDAFDERNIYVINTFTKPVISTKTADTINITGNGTNEFDFSTKINDDKSIRIKTDKSTYGYREKVILNLESLSDKNNGHYILSVRRMNPVEISKQTLGKEKPNSKEIFHIPELRGELISGVVLSKTDNAPAVDKIVSLTVPGKEFIFKLGKTNKSGRFFFSISEEYSSEKSIIQLVNPERDTLSYNLILDKKDLVLDKNDPISVKLDPSLQDWLKERSVQIQIENAYYDKKKDSLLSRATHNPFYDNLGTVYFLDDYTRFPTVKETFIEIIKLAAVRGSGESTRFLVYNDYDPQGVGNFNNIPPLVLMDGMFIQENSELLNYDSMDIKSIRVITEPYRYGPQLYSGIIAVETINNSFIPALVEDNVEEIELKPRVKEKHYLNPDYLSNKSLSRIPDYRVQLLWEPEIELTSEDFTTSFFTSDIPGVYEINLEGFSKSGLHKTAKSYFEVRED